jgi:hydroxymethylbilane synthase
MTFGFSVDSAPAKNKLVIGTRASKLALVQSEIVRSALLDLSPDLEVTLHHVTTQGDAVQDRPLSAIGGNGLFVTKIEEALRACTVDIAVHSAKDLPSVLAADMTLAAFLPRADVRDVLVSREKRSLADLPYGARVGTSSPRRSCQLRAMRPDLEILDIRGNVDTRLRKLREGQYEAIVLAAAGLERLGLLEVVTEWFEPQAMIPAVAQGALAVETRTEDTFTRSLVGGLNDPLTATVVRAERAFLGRIGGGCSLPVAAFASVRGEGLHIAGMVGSESGEMLRGEYEGAASDPEQAGEALADLLISQGASRFIELDLATHGASGG